MEASKWHLYCLLWLSPWDPYVPDNSSRICQMERKFQWALWKDSVNILQMLMQLIILPKVMCTVEDSYLTLPSYKLYLELYEVDCLCWILSNEKHWKENGLCMASHIFRHWCLILEVGTGDFSVNRSFSLYVTISHHILSNLSYIPVYMIEIYQFIRDVWICIHERSKPLQMC